MLNNPIHITPTQFDETPIVMVLVEGCINCDYYEKEAQANNIPILKLEHANFAPFSIIESNGMVYSPALWIEGSKTVSPSNLLIRIVRDYLIQNKEI